MSLSLEDFRQAYKEGYGLADDLEARKERAEALTAALVQVATAERTLSAHWVNGNDDGLDYCRACALKSIRQQRQEGRQGLSLGGGHATEHDGPIYCEECGVRLEGFLTDCGAESELQHFADHCLEDDMLSTYDATALIEALGCAAYISRIMPLFDCICTWLEDLFDRGAVQLPYLPQRCLCSDAAYRASKRVCRVRRVRRATCPRLTPEMRC